MTAPAAQPRSAVGSAAAGVHGAAPAPVEVLAAVMTIVAIFGVAFVVPQPLWSGQPARPGATSPIADPAAEPTLVWAGLALALGYALAWSLPFRPYLRAVAMAHVLSHRWLVALTLLLASVALLVFPAFGSDMFVYVDYARLWAIYADHPLLTAPIARAADWAFQFVWIPAQPSPYGPLWAVLTWPIARVAGTSIGLNVFGYKLVMLLGYGACCWLIWTAPDRQRDRARALALFAWSPLVLFETLAKAHNDVLLAVTALLAVRLAGRGGPVLAILGGLVKATGLAILPSTALELVRQRAWRALGVNLLVGCAIAVAAYAPFWRGPATLLPIFAQTARVVWSPGSLLIAAGADPAMVRILLLGVWVACSLLIFRRVTDVATSACLILLATTLLLTTAVFAHYLVPAVALAAVSPETRLQRLVMALSIGAMASYAVELLNVSFGPTFIGSPSFQILGSLVLLLPVCLALRNRPRLSQ